MTDKNLDGNSFDSVQTANTMVKVCVLSDASMVNVLLHKRQVHIRTLSEDIDFLSSSFNASVRPITSQEILSKGLVLDESLFIRGIVKTTY